MPYDSVYLEKRTPGALRTVWRKFYGDATAMMALRLHRAGVGVVFGGWFARTASTSSSSVINCCRRHGHATVKFHSSLAPMTWAAMC
ncbi:hypothetical protein ACNKHQ_07615 [Shigella flexneri]